MKEAETSCRFRFQCDTGGYPTKLPDVYRYFGIALNHHEALSDAMACAQIVLAANRQPATQDVGRRRNSAAR